MSSQRARHAAGFKVKVSLITLLIGLAGTVIGGPVEAKGNVPRPPTTVQVEVHVVKQDGGKLTSATAYACPADQDITRCTSPITASTGPNGKATLKLVKSQRYNVTAFVSDPNPPWACAGNFYNGHELYVADNQFTADATQFPKHATVVIHKPKASECARVPVLDDLGNEALGASAFVCVVNADGTCTSAPSPNMDREGRLWMIIADAAVTYRLSPFIVNSGWPCGLILDDGVSEFHGGEPHDFSGADLLAGNVALVIHHPSASECS